MIVDLLEDLSDLCERVTALGLRRQLDRRKGRSPAQRMHYLRRGSRRTLQRGYHGPSLRAARRAGTVSGPSPLRISRGKLGAKTRAHRAARGVKKTRGTLPQAGGGARRLKAKLAARRQRGRKPPGAMKQQTFSQWAIGLGKKRA